eukprot:scaffold38072_cov60-Phaeocystis_antarctica.AAC.1
MSMLEPSPSPTPSPEPSPTPEDSPPPSPPPPSPSPPSPNPPSPPAPAPPCTVEMLKQRPAGDKSWPIACSDTTLGGADKELDLSGAHLSYGDFKDATFTGTGAIRLNGAGLANADLSGSKITTETSYAAQDGSDGDATIDFSGANLAGANLSGSELTATAFYTADGAYAEATIDFSGAELAGADLSGAELDAVTVSYGEATIDFTEASLVNADLSGSKLKADAGNEGVVYVKFKNANLANADLRDAELTASGSIAGVDGPTIDFTNANLTNADWRGAELNALGSDSYSDIDFSGATGANLTGATLTADGAIIGLTPASSPSTVVAVDLPLTAVGESTGYDGVAALLIAALLIAIPLVGTMYVAARHGAGKVPLWFKLHFSHSNPNVVWFYLSAEERSSMRQKLCGDKGDSLAATEPTADENFGPSRRPGLLLPTPAAGSTPTAITAAQKWLAQAEDAEVSGSSC